MKLPSVCGMDDVENRAAGKRKIFCLAVGHLSSGPVELPWVPEKQQMGGPTSSKVMNQETPQDGGFVLSASVFESDHVVPV